MRENRGACVAASRLAVLSEVPAPVPAITPRIGGAKVSIESQGGNVELVHMCRCQCMLVM